MENIKICISQEYDREGRLCVVGLEILQVITVNTDVSGMRFVFRTTEAEVGAIITALWRIIRN